MSPTQRTVADAAIGAKPRYTYDEVHSDIASAVGMSKAAVEAVIEELVAEYKLRRCATPARHVELEPPRKDSTRGWYEKGELWK